MVGTYPLTVSYNECLGSRATSLSFANLRVVDLRNGQSQYLRTLHLALLSRVISLAPDKNAFDAP